MARWRKQQQVGDNLRDLYAKLLQGISSGLGDSSIDWDDDGDDGSSLDITVNDNTVAKYGHDGSRHGFLVPDGGGWQTVQEDAQGRADQAAADAKAYADTKATTTLNAAKSYTDDREDAVRNWADNRMDSIGATISALTNLYNNLENRVSALEH
jgi:hypothetical protein